LLTPCFARLISLQKRKFVVSPLKVDNVVIALHRRLFMAHIFAQYTCRSLRTLPKNANKGSANSFVFSEGKLPLRSARRSGIIKSNKPEFHL
jgi:hypothetical protein